ncbi:MAG TPA: ABC transporter transmembrane domain-containing protein, partial [Candidatus Nitrosotenuis sp.]|nr:ABC transporter transmembrane domain-containing protein [Candidatus Nitrosotenuis sp.]
MKAKKNITEKKYSAPSVTGLVDLFYRFINFSQTPSSLQKGKFKFPTSYILTSSLCINILSLMLPLMVFHTYNRVIPYEGYDTMIVLMLIVFVALILEVILRLVRAYLIGWAGIVYEHTTSTQAINQLLAAKQDEIDQHSPGQYIQGIVAVSKLREFYSGQVLIFFVDFPFIFVYLLLIAYIGKILVIVPAILIIIFFYFIWINTLPDLTNFSESESADIRKTSFIIEMLNGIHTIKSLGIEQLFLRRAERLQENLTRSNFATLMTTGSTMNIIIILSQLMTVGIATIGCIMVVYGYINMGGLAACILLAGRIMYPFQRSVTFIYRLNEYESAQDKLNSLLKLHRESYTKTDFDKKLKVEISQLGYQPQEQNKPLFEDINFSHSKPGIIGLRGPEGAGKTCFYKLISGILTPTTGQILINGVDPRHIPEKVYPTTISYISNKSAIFKGTIRENLTFFGSIPWSMAEAVAKKLRIPNSISHLPLGYETQ